MNATEPIHPELPTGTLCAWPQRLARFSPLMEGGPGKPLTLLINLALSFLLARHGRNLLESEGISSAGPALFFLAVFWMASVAFWVLIKGGFRSLDCVQYISESGVGILPSPEQQKLDAVMVFFSKLVFLLTFKGGQWSAWSPFTRWKDVRKVTLLPDLAGARFQGGNWTILLTGYPEGAEALEKLIRDYVRAERIR